MRPGLRQHRAEEAAVHGGREVVGQDALLPLLPVFEPLAESAGNKTHVMML